MPATTQTGTSSVERATPSFIIPNDPPISTTSAASSTSTQNQYNNGELHTLSTILPGFLIAFICVISILLVCGIFHTRRRRALLLRHIPAISAEPPEPMTPTPPRARRKKKRAVKPKLWDVDIKGVSWGRDIEALEPVAMELLAVPKPKESQTGNQKRGNWFAPNRLARSHKPEDEERTVRQAQVTVLLTMPAPGCRTGTALRSYEYVIGTAHLPYRLAESEDEPDRADEEKQREHESKMTWDRLRAFERFSTPFE